MHMLIMLNEVVAFIKINIWRRAINGVSFLSIFYEAAGNSHNHVINLYI